MERVLRIARAPRLLAATVGLASVSAILSALVMQFGFGLYPCTLCIYQRIPFVALIGVSALAVVARTAVVRIGCMALTCLLLASSVGLAGYHMGVEQGVFEGTSSCSPDATGDASLDDLKAMIEAAPIASCSDVAAEFLGFSIAGWNMLFSLSLLLLQLYGTHHALRKKTA